MTFLIYSGLVVGTWLSLNFLFLAVVYVQKILRPELDRKRKLKIVSRVY